MYATRKYTTPHLFMSMLILFTLISTVPALAQRVGGTLWVTGKNSHGQLGLGNTTGVTRYTQVPGMDDVIAVAACYGTSLALKSDGAVWAAGTNSSGRTGLGNMASATTFTRVPQLDNVAAICTTRCWSLAIKRDGTLWATKLNYTGAFMGAQNDGLHTFTQVPGISDVREVLGCDTFILVICNDGKVYGVGTDEEGLLWDPPKIRYFLTEIPHLAGMPRVSCSAISLHTVTREGNVRACGNNIHGNLGLGDVDPRMDFQQVPDLRNIAMVHTACTYAFVIAGDGTLYATGADSRGGYPSMLGLGERIPRVAFARVPGIGDIVSIVGCGDNSIALQASGRLWAVGGNHAGEHGVGDTVERDAFTCVPNIENVIAVAGLSDHVLVIRKTDSDHTLCVRSQPCANIQIEGAYGYRTPHMSAVKHGTAISLTAPRVHLINHFQHARFSHWVVNDVPQPDAQTTLTHSVDMNTIVTAVYEVPACHSPSEYTLELTSSPSPQVELICNKSEIMTPAKITFDQVQSVTLAAPERIVHNGLEYDFIRWDRANRTISTQPAVGFNVDSGNVPVCAVYDRPSARLLVKDNVNAGCEVQGSHPGRTTYWKHVKFDTPVRLTAPSHVHTGQPERRECPFLRWSLNGALQPEGQRTLEFTMSEETEAIAQFVGEGGATLNVTTTGAIKVPILGDYAGTTDYSQQIWQNEEVALTAPEFAYSNGTYYEFIDWEVSPWHAHRSHATDRRLSLKITACEVTASAKYLPVRREVTLQSKPIQNVAITVTPANHIVHTNGVIEIADQTEATFRAPAAVQVDLKDYGFVGWRQDDGTLTDTMAFRVTADATLLAEYAAVPRSLTVEALPVGNVAVTGTQAGTTPYTATVEDHASLTLTAPSVVSIDGTPWTFRKWIVNGEGQSELQNTISFDIEQDTRVFAVYDNPSSMLWAAGSNNENQFGAMPMGEYECFVPILNAQDVQKVKAGYHRTCLIKKDGTVWETRVDISVTPPSRGFVQIEGLPNIVDIAVGYRHTLAIDGDGKVWAWGDNQYGQLGMGHCEAVASPQQVPNMDHAVSISASGGKSAVVRDDGSLWVAGNNRMSDYAQYALGALGVPNIEVATSFVQVQNLTSVVKAIFGVNNTLALRDDGCIWATGELRPYYRIDSPYYMLSQRATEPVMTSGFPTITDPFYRSFSRHEFAPLTAPGRFIDFTCNASGYDSALVALADDGTVWEAEMTYLTAFAKLPDVTMTQLCTDRVVVTIESGPEYLLALTTDSAVLGKGLNRYGQLGLAGHKNYQGFQQLTGFGAARGIAAGLKHAIVLGQATANPAFRLHVTSMPNMGNVIQGIPSDNTELPSGTLVNLTAPMECCVRDTDYLFEHWIVNGVQMSDGEAALSFTIDHNTLAVACYTPCKRMLRVASQPIEGINISGDAGGLTEYVHELDDNSLVELTAPEVPEGQAGEYVFKEWRLDGQAMEQENATCQFRINQDSTATAVYCHPLTLTLEATPSECVGAIALDDRHCPDLQTTKWYASPRQLRLAAQKGMWRQDRQYQFLRWQLNGKAQPDGQNELTLDLANDAEAVAEYALIPHAFSLCSSPITGISISGTHPGQTDYRQAVTSGTTVTLTAPGTVTRNGQVYRFKRWKHGSGLPTRSSVIHNDTTWTATYVVDDAPPYISETIPENGAVQVPTDIALGFQINDALLDIDTDTLQVTVQVRGATPLAGTTHINALDYGKWTVIFQPEASLPADSQIEAIVNVSDCGGNAMPEYRMSFHTVMTKFGAGMELRSGLASRPHVATATDHEGGVWAVWDEVNEFGNGVIYAARRDPNQQEFSTPFAITSEEADFRCPGIAALRTDFDTTLSIACQVYNGLDWDICVHQADMDEWAAGQKLTTYDILHPYREGDQTHPRIAMRNGHPLIIWQDSASNASGINLYHNGSEIQVTTQDEMAVTPVVAVSSTSETAYVIWQSAATGDLYCANSNDWSQRAQLTDSHCASNPAATADPLSEEIHLAWTDRKTGDADVLYARFAGLPENPPQGLNIADDTAHKDQDLASISVEAQSGSSAVYVSWEDWRNQLANSDSDIYFARVYPEASINILVYEDAANTRQSHPIITCGPWRSPLILWVNHGADAYELMFAGAMHTFPPESAYGGASGTQRQSVEVITSGPGGTPGVVDSYEDARFSFPFSYKWPLSRLRCSISRIRNCPQLPNGGLAAAYEFSPSGFQFDEPAQVVIPYIPTSDRAPRPYWYDETSGTWRTSGITNIQHEIINDNLHAVKFQTNHFTLYAIGNDTESHGGGGCSATGQGGGDVGVMLLPWLAAGIAVAMRLRRKRREATN